MGQAALKLETKGEWLSESAIAKEVKLHRQTVASRLEELGYDPDPERTTANKKIYWFDDEMKFAILAAKDSLSAAKMHGVRLDNEIKKMKLAEARGELVQMAEVVELIQKFGVAIYQEMSVRSPKRIGAKLAKAKNVTDVKKVMKIDADKVLKILRDNFEGFIE